MSADKIRIEYERVITRALLDVEKRPKPITIASRIVAVADALAEAGFLPTGVEYKPDPAEWPRREYRVMRRYVGDWQQDPDADWSLTEVPE
jgi:hypothetical protein